MKYKPKFFEFEFHPDREFSWHIQKSWGCGFACARPIHWSYRVRTYYWGWWRIEVKYKITQSLERGYGK